MRRLCRSVYGLALATVLGGSAVWAAEPGPAADSDRPGPNGPPEYLALPYGSLPHQSGPAMPSTGEDGPTASAPVAEPVPLPERSPALAGKSLMAAPNMIGDFSDGLRTGSAFKSADNESPRPEDRLFTTYSYFPDVRSRFPQTHFHQELFGFEKTLLDGDASLGLRAPLFEIQGDGLSRSDFGDLSILLKYAWLNQTRTGDVLSTGLVVTVPTGPESALSDGTMFHPVILQPYLGGVFNQGRFYIHGFTSLAVPTEARDLLLLFNDWGIGYRFYQSRELAVLSYLIPTIEAHISTPLNHRNARNSGSAASDEVIFTYGVHLGLFKKTQLTLGLATPVTGPLPFDLEALAQVNWRF